MIQGLLGTSRHDPDLSVSAAGQEQPNQRLRRRSLYACVQELSQAKGTKRKVALERVSRPGECWLSYNAALTATDLGYTNLYWYRGGISAWNQARLPVVRTKLLKQF